MVQTRLLLVMFVCGIGINVLLLAGLVAHRAFLADAFRNGIAQYVQYLVADLGMPPDFNRAVELAGRTGMVIYYSSPEASWSTSGKEPAAPVERIHTWHQSGPVEAGGFSGHHYLIYRMDPNRRFLFEVVGGPDHDRRLLWMGPVLFLLVTLLLIASYLWIRRIMFPLRQLTQGVRRFGAGHLDERVPVRSLDELGELASAFNQMADRLQHLIRSKDRMLLDVSHELRTPLTRMKVALEMSPEGALKESLAEDVDEMEHMVTTILTNARAQSGRLDLDRQRVNLLWLIRDAIVPFHNQAPGVCLLNSAESVEVSVDPDKIRTLLRNLVGNAVKYSKTTSGPVQVMVHANSESCSVEIRDDGIGISEEDLPFVFEPFYRVDPSRSRETGGFGLGLSLCRAIMEAHGGSISIMSTFGEGTSVQLNLPRGC
jgi:signal transduction histidine kinase